MPKTRTLRIDDTTYKTFMKFAKADNRSLANFIETAVKAHIRESAFVDDSEMAEILANEQLVNRLNKRLQGGQTEKRKPHWLTFGFLRPLLFKKIFPNYVRLVSIESRKTSRTCKSSTP